MTDQTTNILIAGGKTGGHLFPGIAIAQALMDENNDVNILFAGIGTEFELEIVKNFGFNYSKFYSRPIKGKNPLSLFFSLFIIPVSIIQSLIIILKFKPSLVIGTGGYSSFAIVAAAWLAGIKTAIQEQNTIPGLTNRMLSKIVHIIFLNFKKTKILSDKKCAVHTGNPVRKITKNMDVPELDNLKDKFTLLVSGGSQGATSINNAVVEALSKMENIDRYFIIHQTGKHDEKIIQKLYSNLGINNVIVKAFFNNIAFYQDIADLIIARAGAGTISEINLKGLPSILVPYPYAADDHQSSNAKELEKINAAIVIKDNELTGAIVKYHIESLNDNREKLEQMANASLSLAMPGADKKIAKKILNMTFKQG
jgi:UDP-N-acetylglucosamine--N-acetylmuramyl-(pentapeptide) pyrophosphoryl-undecaprenol N-acetylglucosamine transferase